MSHHASKLGFIIRRLYGAHVDVYRASGESEGIDLFEVHHVKTKRPLVWSRRVRGQLLTELLHILRDGIGLGKYRHLPIHFRGSFSAQFHILLRRVLVESRFNLETAGRRLDDVLREQPRQSARARPVNSARVR